MRNIAFIPVMMENILKYRRLDKLRVDRSTAVTLQGETTEGIRTRGGRKEELGPKQ